MQTHLLWKLQEYFELICRHFGFSLTPHKKSSPVCHPRIGPRLTNDFTDFFLRAIRLIYKQGLKSPCYKQQFFCNIHVQ